MPYIIVSSWWPSHKGDEAVNKYLEVLKKYNQSKIPGKLIVPVAVTTTKNGVKTVRIREIKKDDAQGFADALTMTGEQMAEFQEIEGYEYKVRIWSTASEALASIKREGPE
jgi:hypothetical protein